MRSIHFRCWDTKNRQWLTEVPPEEYMLDSDCWDHPDNDHELMMTYPHNPLIFLKGRLIYDQFTGLQDKHDKDIYEGDLITFSLGFQDPFGAWQFLKQHGHAWVSYYAEHAAFILGTKSLHYLHEATDIEIVGNLHEGLKSSG